MQSRQLWGLKLLWAGMRGLLQCLQCIMTQSGPNILPGGTLYRCTGMLGVCLNCSICQLHEAQALVQLAVTFGEPLPELALLVPVTCSSKLPMSAWEYASRQQVAMAGDLEFFSSNLCSRRQIANAGLISDVL